MDVGVQFGQGYGVVELDEVSKGVAKLQRHEEVREGLRRQPDPAHPGEGGQRGALPHQEVLRGSPELLGLLLVELVLLEASVVVHLLLLELGQHTEPPLLRPPPVVHLPLGGYVVLPYLPLLGGGEGMGRRGGWDGVGGGVEWGGGWEGIKRRDGG